MTGRIHSKTQNNRELKKNQEKPQVEKRKRAIFLKINRKIQKDYKIRKIKN